MRRNKHQQRTLTHFSSIYLRCHTFSFEIWKNHLAPSQQPSEYVDTINILWEWVGRGVNVRKNSQKWYKYKLEKSYEVIKDLQSTPVTPEEVEGILPLQKIQPKKTKVKRITQVHGLLSAAQLLDKVKEMAVKEK